ncbi:MAG: glycerophosphodiester phosphodiesterase, partial [bacterium]|nr:glycerophosphodiester phosphodiesterase [bacterium]
FVFRGRGLVAPTLSEVLRRFPTTRLNLEMKEFTPDLAAKLCHLLAGGAATDRALVASFGHEAMSAFRQACPEVATSATMREGLSLYVLSQMRLASLYRSPASALQIPENFGGRTALEPRLIELAGALNLQVQVWTVNEEADMRRLLDMGVQGILTDYPDRLLRVMGRQRAVAEPRLEGAVVAR